MSTIAKSSIIHPNVELGENCTIEDNCIIGVPGKGSSDGEKTILGKNSHIRAGSIIYAGNQIGDNFQTGNRVNIRENNQIGSNVSIGTGSVIEHQIVIEDDVRIHSLCFVPEFSKIHSGAWIGPSVVLTNAKYPNQSDTKDNLVGPTIGSGARIGANSTILPGVKIGAGSFIGAASLVSKDVPDNKLAFGHPAKIQETSRS